MLITSWMFCWVCLEFLRQLTDYFIDLFKVLLTGTGANANWPPKLSNISTTPFIFSVFSLFILRLSLLHWSYSSPLLVFYLTFLPSLSCLAARLGRALCISRFLKWVPVYHEKRQTIGLCDRGAGRKKESLCRKDAEEKVKALVRAGIIDTASCCFLPVRHVHRKTQCEIPAWAFVCVCVCELGQVCGVLVHRHGMHGDLYCVCFCPSNLHEHMEINKSMFMYSNSACWNCGLQNNKIHHVYLINMPWRENGFKTLHVFIWVNDFKIDMSVWGHQNVTMIGNIYHEKGSEGSSLGAADMTDWMVHLQYKRF